MNTQSTIEKMSEHFKEMKDASPEKTERLAQEIETLLNQSRERFYERKIACDNWELAEQLNLI